MRLIIFFTLDLLILAHSGEASLGWPHSNPATLGRRVFSAHSENRFHNVRRLTNSGRAHCGPLSKELVHGVARNNFVMITAIDQLLWRAFGPSFIENIQAANISYWLIAALDPTTSLALGALGVTQCFNAPSDRLRLVAKDPEFTWGSHYWKETTWNKVSIVRSVYELGVHVIHSDADVVWFNDPLPYFEAQLAGPAHIMISLDSLDTGNTRGDRGLERQFNPFANINTGIYLIRQWPGGLDFLDKVWLPLRDADFGHDQDGFNRVTRGRKSIESGPECPGGQPVADPIRPDDPYLRIFYATCSNTTAVGYLPPSMFGNTYTYVVVRLWQVLDHPLYAVHWVWGGRTMESKRQCMRDAMKYHDEPDYYTSPDLVTFDLEQMQMPPDFNSWPGTEEMIRFHVAAANFQLQQFYYALGIALVANRTLVLPRFLCYCAKNWYQTQKCRINEETATVFPFVCSLSQLLRTRRLEQGFTLPGNTEFSGHKVHIREYSFLENPKVPDHIKASYMEILPSDQPRPRGATVSQPEQQLVMARQPAPGGRGERLVVAAPLSDDELRAVLEAQRGVRVLHFPAPARTLSGFRTATTGRQFDAEVQQHTAYWCCRSPHDMKAMNLTAMVQLVALPPERYGNLDLAKRDSCYLHDLGPIVRPEGTQWL